MKKLTFLFIAMLLLFNSCSKDDSKNLDVKDKIAANRAMIREKIKLHSAGLKYFFNSLNRTEIKTKTDGPPIIPPYSTLSSQDVKNNIVSFLNQNSVPQTKELAIIYEGFVDNNTQVLSLAGLGFQFSALFYQLGLDITTVSGTNVVDVSSNIDLILNSSDFLSLSEIEQNILIASAETYIDSFAYWSENNITWNDIAASYNGYKENPTTKSHVLTTIMYARSDAKGALAGGIGGAVSGAIVGAVAGGIGAGPGALAGFVGGAISGALSASILTYLNNVAILEVPIVENYTPIETLYVPEIWTKVAMTSNTTIPQTVTFVMGNIVVTN